MPGVLCRVDAGGDRGLGHLQRCLALAQALQPHGLGTVVLAPPLDEVRRRIGAAGCAFEPLDALGREAGTARDWRRALDVARARGCELAVCDSYDIDDRYLAALRGGGLFVVAIDDLARHPFSAHIVVNGAAGVDERSYRSATGDTRFLLGARYALLGPAFWSPAARCVAAEVTRVLVAVGGGDPYRLLPRLLDVLDAISSPFAITAVRGPFDASRPDTGARRYRHHIDVLEAPATLHDIMSTADVALSAGGQTLYELAATGIPTVAVQAFDNQRMNLQHLMAAGAVRCAGSITDPDLDTRLSSELQAVIADPHERARMSAAARSAVDGRGAIRAADAIVAATTQARTSA
jgi:spore coat polysaccharide biosynthesis predicted glycosyltransferase SpsG